MEFLRIFDTLRVLFKILGLVPRHVTHVDEWCNWISIDKKMARWTTHGTVQWFCYKKYKWTLLWWWNDSSLQTKQIWSNLKARAIYYTTSSSLDTQINAWSTQCHFHTFTICKHMHVVHSLGFGTNLDYGYTYLRRTNMCIKIKHMWHWGPLTYKRDVCLLQQQFG